MELMRIRKEGLSQNVAPEINLQTREEEARWEHISGMWNIQYKGREMENRVIFNRLKISQYYEVGEDIERSKCKLRDRKE